MMRQLYESRLDAVSCSCYSDQRRRVEVSAPFFSLFLFFVLRHYAHASREISLSPRYNTRVKSKMADILEMLVVGLKT